MNEYHVPEYFLMNKSKIRSAFIIPYRTKKSSLKNRVILTSHMFSFLTQGSKEIVSGNINLRFDNSAFALVKAGKCFMSENISDTDEYATTLLFFDNHLLQEFFEFQKNAIQEIIRKKKLIQREMALFSNDGFTRSYIQSLQFVTDKSEDFIKLKLREILLYLLETYPMEFCSLFAEQTETSEEIRFKNIIASHIDSNLSVSELAYLCNVSLSTFKRKFFAIYNDSPTNWIRQKRMEHAAFLLKYNKERVSEIYFRLGYQNHSSFSQSFKTVFGVSPKKYQLEK